MKKVLIITYYWPPGSGAGVQRWLKFSKYLPEFGWDPVILTVDPEFATYPATDNSLADEISPDLKIYKTKAADYFRFYARDKSKVPSAGFASDDNKSFKSRVLRFIRGNFFIPDPRKGWNKYAFNKASYIIENEDIKHVITTSPPHSSQLLGIKLKKKFPSITWFADLRDPWTGIYYYDQFYPTILSKWIDQRYEKKVLQTADRIITVGRSLKEHFVTIVPQIENKTEIITNGFDDEDFRSLIPAAPEKFTISYIGTLSDVYPVKDFLDALCSIKERGIEFNLRFIGTISPAQIKKIRSKIEDYRVEFISYVNHNEAIKYMLNSNLLLLVIPEHQSNKSIITGKIFEYVASGRPVICLGPVDGDAAEIIRSAEAGSTFDYSDKKAIEDFVIRISREVFKPDREKVLRYSRKELTRKIAELLES